jgi:hypothetical protein
MPEEAEPDRRPVALTAAEDVLAVAAAEEEGEAVPVLAELGGAVAGAAANASSDRVRRPTMAAQRRRSVMLLVQIMLYGVSPRARAALRSPGTARSHPPV